MTRKSSLDETLCIIGACHGLTCVLLNTCKTHSERIYLFNLISAERIPDPLSNHVYHHNEKKETVYQFGFIPSANKFKLLRFVFNGGHFWGHSDINFTRNIADFDSLAIFTVGEDDDWRPLPADSVSILPSDTFPLSSFVTFNGIVHWINNRLRIITTFDLGQEKGGRISLPTLVEYFEIKVLKDRLSLVEYHFETEIIEYASGIFKYGSDPEIMESVSEIICRKKRMWIEDEITIWTMKEYPIEESWTKEYVISIEPDFKFRHQTYDHLDVVAVQPTGDILFSSGRQREDPICYNPREKKWKLFRDVYGVSMRGYEMAGVAISDLNPNLLLEG